MECYRLRRSPLSSVVSSPSASVPSAFLFLCCLLCGGGGGSSASSSPSPPATTGSLVVTPPSPRLQQGISNNSTGDQYLALLAFRSAIVGDPTGALSSWNDSSQLCRWPGIECSTGRPPSKVVGLRLRSLGLLGSIHAAVSNLTFLRTLDLSDNKFQGHIPGELCHGLPHLRLLNLSMNSLEGWIPAGIGLCSEARHISLWQNSLSGVIPPSLGNLSFLRTLYLSENRLTGSIPPQLGGAATLTELSLGDNNLTGGIPPSLGNFTKLDTLSFTRNFLCGTIPPAIGFLNSLTWFSGETNGFTGAFPSPICNLSSLSVLGLGGNQFSGILPPNIGTLFPNLQLLSLGSNRFHGVIPSSIANASSLRVIQMTFNALTGVLPPTLGNLGDLATLTLRSNRLESQSKEDWGFLTSLGNCTQLKILDLGNNTLGGSLPEAVSNLSRSLEKLALHDNLISGRIPHGVGDLERLTVLYLGNNLIEGGIPRTVGSLRDLALLFLGGNRLSGQIPTSIFNLTRLSFLSVEMNQLEGALPPSIGNMQRLQRVSFSANRFNGTVPKELLSISTVTTLDLSDNSFSGALPTEIHQLRAINKLDVSDNDLSGEIPSSMGDCQLLVSLHMQGNNFRGKIPQSFDKLRGLEIFDVSRNNLSGSVPGFLQEFRFLTYLNLSFNNFDGEVPKGGIFGNASIISVMGNPRLCGGVVQLHLSPCLGGDSHRRALLITIITVPGVFFCTAAIFVIVCIILPKWKTTASAVRHSNELLPRVTYSELFGATEGFSPSNLIGTGSFGSVYRGEMVALASHGNKFVAVKVINLQQHGASKSFMNECEALRNIRHRNLIKILTSCSSTDFCGNDFKALVFEFMQNGSLERWLHPVGNESGDDQVKSLSLGERVNVAVDVASAISYLHGHGTKPIVHRDLKPSNILLDGFMTAHVGDFGLARFLPIANDEGRNNTSTNSSAFTGSIGYVAPEYGMGCSASIEGDVYSYGILLLEMITGRRPTDAQFVDDSTLRKFVQMAIPHHVWDIADPLLRRETSWINHIDSSGSSSSINNVMEEARAACLVSMAELGLRCSMDSPKERMRMEDVAKEMTVIKERFLGTTAQRKC